MSFQAEIRTLIGWRWSDGATYDARLDYARQWLDAHAAGAEAAWLTERQPLGNGQSVAFDLTYLVRDVLGDKLVTAFAGVHVLLMVNHAPDGGTLCVGGAEADAWNAPFGAGPLIVAPDGAAMLASRAAPWPVDHARRNLRLAAAGGDVQYSLALLGMMSGSGSSGV